MVMNTKTVNYWRKPVNEIPEIGQEVLAINKTGQYRLARLTFGEAARAKFLRTYITWRTLPKPPKGISEKRNAKRII